MEYDKKPAAGGKTAARKKWRQFNAALKPNREKGAGLSGRRQVKRLS